MSCPDCSRREVTLIHEKNNLRKYAQYLTRRKDEPTPSSSPSWRRSEPMSVWRRSSWTTTERNAMPNHKTRGPVAKPEPPLKDCQTCGATLARWYDLNTCEFCQLQNIFQASTRKALS
ncbi:hypothetical protein GS425_17310 [Rhodococcus hoagii]|nr:hypothetical protein [Prescottella equi]